MRFGYEKSPQKSEDVQNISLKTYFFLVVVSKQGGLNVMLRQLRTYTEKMVVEPWSGR